MLGAQFDFGLAKLDELAQQSGVQWVLSNVLHESPPDRPLVHGALLWHVVELSGIRVGFIGLGEEEWLTTMPNRPEHLRYVDFVETARTLCRHLRSEQGCSFLIALTHMREPNDIHLARSVPELNLVLGGHDHFYNVQTIGTTTVMRSGTDFRDLTVIDATLGAGSSDWSIATRHVEVTRAFEPDVEIVVRECPLIGFRGDLTPLPDGGGRLYGIPQRENVTRDRRNRSPSSSSS
jgi:5'-nucleotidase